MKKMETEVPLEVGKALNNGRSITEYAEKASDRLGYPVKEYGCFGAEICMHGEKCKITWHRLDEGHRSSSKNEES